jgi:glycosyltransferase involved in cell wall biosynthesis
LSNCYRLRQNIYIGEGEISSKIGGRRIRVLIIAEDCNPEWPSLPVVGYKAARAIADYADVVVATHIRNRENIQKIGFGRATVRYVDNEYIARPTHELATFLRGGSATGWTTGIALSYPAYLAFEWEVWKCSRDELRRGDFDIVHRLTPMSPTLPSPMASWSPVPFVIGPLNGGLKWPLAYRDELAREREWLTYVRGLYKALPYRRSTYKKSAAVLAAFQHTLDDIPKYANVRAINFPEVGIDPSIFNEVKVRADRKQKTILFAGRFVPYKLPTVVARAFADRPSLHRHRLVMVGDGPERPAIEELIHQRGLQSQVQLLGWKTQAEVAALMREADIFAFPSIRELGAGVVVEAMACGLACVVVDYGAPGALIAEDRGAKVPLGSREQLLQGFGDALERLLTDELTVGRLGRSAREHAMQFYTWEAKARKMLAVYEWVLDRRSRPDFWGFN